MKQKRKLAAIMFTDIVGYTALMGSDEKKAFELLRKNRNIQKLIITKYRGKWLKEMGDGILASFHTVSEAVLCAIEIQMACKSEPNLKLRIGIHQGEIIFENKDVFGDGVNIASRIQELAPSGEILVSGAVYKDIKNKSEIDTEYIEEKIFKNVAEPIMVYKVTGNENITKTTDQISQAQKHKRRLVIYLITAGIILCSGILFIWKIKPSTYTPGNSTNIKSDKIVKSIAVLPFKDMSPERDQEYLGDGISEEIINRLTKFSDFKVIGRTSSFSFKNKESDLRTIGEMLNATIILEGSVQKSGDKLRITAQLINAEDGLHIWSQRFDRAFTDVFSIQDEIAQLVVSSINSEISDTDKKITGAEENVDIDAYDLFLKGKHIHQMYLFGEKMDDFLSSEKLFLGAIAINPKYGLAHAGLADLYNSYTNINYSVNDPHREKYLGLQKSHIQLAYKYVPSSDYVHVVKGSVYLAFHDLDSAYLSFIEALQINQNAENLFTFASFHKSIGLYNEALRILIKAKNMDPLDVAVLMRMAVINKGYGNFDLALNEVNDIILIRPDYNFIYKVKVEILVSMNKTDEAYDLLLERKEKNPEGNYLYWEGLIYAAKKEKEKALKLNKESGEYFALLGMREEYIESILSHNSRAGDLYNPYRLKTRTDYLLIINSEYYDWVKDDPRIKEIVKKEKEKYEILKSKFGDLDFIEL